MKESEVCEKFIPLAEEDGWKVYPEVGQWDLLMEWDRDDVQLSRGMLQTGDQVGVEAKARANVKALYQCIRRMRGQDAPHFACVLAPKITKEYRLVAARLGIGQYSLEHFFKYEGTGLEEHRPEVKAPPFEKNGDGIWTPPVNPDIQAGVRSPSALTKWRVNALKLCKVLRCRGYVTSKDFQALDLSMTIWKRKWLTHVGKIGRLYKYEALDKDDFPDKGWEEVRDQLELTDDEKWDADEYR